MPIGVIASDRSENILPIDEARAEYQKYRDEFEARMAMPGEQEIGPARRDMEWAAEQYMHAKNAQLTPETAHTDPIRPGFGHLMTIDEFEAAVLCGGFIDYDGGGRYATETCMSGLGIMPSHLPGGFVYPNWTHVVWFNR